MRDTQSRRAFDRAVEEGIVEGLEVVDRSRPFSYAEYVSKSSGERYYVTLRSCTCPAAVNDKICKHRAALAIVCDRVDDLLPVTGEVMMQAGAKVAEAIAFRRRNPSTGFVTGSMIYGPHRPDGVPEDEIAYVAFERINSSTVETGKQTWYVNAQGTVVEGPIREFQTRPANPEDHKRRLALLG